MFLSYTAATITPPSLRLLFQSFRELRYKQRDSKLRLVRDGWAVAIAALARLEKKETPRAEDRGQTHSAPAACTSFPFAGSCSQTCISLSHPTSLAAFIEQGFIDIQSSSDQQASTIQGFMLHLAAPLTASEVTRMYRTWSVRVFSTTIQTACMWNAWSLRGLLHIHYLLLFFVCLLLRSRHDIDVTSTSKRLVAPSCTLRPIYCFSCSITAGALIVRSLKNSRPSPPCNLVSASIQKFITVLYSHS